MILADCWVALRVLYTLKNARSPEKKKIQDP